MTPVLIPYSDAAQPLREELEQLYTLAFPPEERRAIIDFRLLSQSQEAFAPHVITLGGHFAGLLTWWDFGDFVYGEHFAVLSSLRGSGIGANVLERFVREQCSDRPLVIEVELPKDELSRRRIGFYRRCGLVLHEYDYVQPPYDPSYAPLPMRLMTYGAIAEENLDRYVRQIHEKVYGYG